MLNDAIVIIIIIIIIIIFLFRCGGQNYRSEGSQAVPALPYGNRRLVAW